MTTARALVLLAALVTAVLTLAPVVFAQRDSDVFWERFIGFGPPEALEYDFNSLDEVTTAVDLIVRGHITNVYIGEEWSKSPGLPPLPIVYASVTVDEVLKGVPVSRTPGAVEVQLTIAARSFDVRSVSAPTEEYLWFLIYEPTHRIELGKPLVNSEIAPFAYFRPNQYQAVLRNFNGDVEVPIAVRVSAAYGANKFPLPLQGQRFQLLVDDVRERAGAAPR